MRRREWLMAASAGLAHGQKKIMMPSDLPDGAGFRTMWYNPVPAIDQTKWRLEVGGLVEKPRQFTVQQLRSLPRETQSARMKCVQCWSARTTWGGFRFGSLLDLVKPRKTAKAIRIDCADKWYEYMTLTEMTNPRVMMVLDRAGQPLPDKNGAPLRLLDPSKYGYKSAKLITKITFVEEGKGSMACDIGPYYSPSGEILAGYDTPLDLHPEAAKPGWKLESKARRKIRGGEITEY
ncbi:MAG: molybdopterin-dependent oxidoreductase [Bryobacter sp.]|jgi:sulfoxide reductase catalytic subunit YedY|nr:molybdopterin-dependent oxidoreductase [Bryobacter sp. CoA8 C33]